LSNKNTQSYTRAVLKEFFKKLIKMPPKIEVTAAANGKGKKITREDVETPQSAPPKQVQKKVTSM